MKMKRKQSGFCNDSPCTDTEPPTERLSGLELGFKVNKCHTTDRGITVIDEVTLLEVSLTAESL